MWFYWFLGVIALVLLFIITACMIVSGDISQAEERRYIMERKPPGPKREEWD